MSDLNTLCQGCVFLEESDCELGRLETFSKVAKVTTVKDGDKEYPLIHGRFCNAYRTEDWVNMLPDDGSGYEENVREENLPPVGYLIEFNDSLKDLADGIWRIVMQKHVDPAYIIVVNRKIEYIQEVQEVVEDGLEGTEIPFHIVQLLDDYNPIDMGFQCAKQGWLYCCKGAPKYWHFISDLNKVINEDLEPVLVINGEDEIVFQTSLFKLLNGNQPIVDENGVPDRRSFIERVGDMQSDRKCVFTWEEFSVQVNS